MSTAHPTSLHTDLPPPGAPSPVVTLNLTLEQAEAVCRALDTYTRLALGQLEVVTDLVRDEVIPVRQDSALPRKAADADVCSQVADTVARVKSVLGYSQNGSNGIGHPHTALAGLRAYEVKKVLSKAVAEERNPAPAFRGVNYDGLGPRYTSDPAPVASVASAATVAAGSPSAQEARPSQKGTPK